MNRRFTVIIIIATVLLFILLIALSVARSKPIIENPEAQSRVPTNATNRRNSNSLDNFSEVTPRPTIPQELQTTLVTIQKTLPFESDSLSVDYSSLTNKIYVEQKNEKSDVDFQEFLQKNGLLEIYKANPTLFVITKSKLAQLISREEQNLDFSPEYEPDSPLPSPTSIESYSQNRNQSQYQAFNSLTRSIFSINKIFPTNTPQKSLPNLFLPTVDYQTSPIPSQPTNIVRGKDTTNIPCAAGSDYGAADGYTNGVLTRIRICRVAGMVVNSQVSKQVNDMRDAWVAAGVPLSGGSFRTMAGQISIYQGWCANDGIVGSPPPYPKPPGQTIRCPGGGAPGYSNHQMGMAIDFNCAGSLIPRKYAAASQNKCFQWLSANAGKFGFFEYGYGKTRDGSTGYEGWHWSVNGN